MEDEKQFMQQAITSGQTILDISKQLNLNRNTVARRMKKYGIEKPKIKSHLIVDYFKNIDTNEKAYWLGFLYADGYIAQNGGKTVLDLSSKDEDWLIKFRDTIKSHHKISTHIRKGKYISKSIGISSKEFTSYLISHGCINCKSKIITLPNFYNEELDLSFLLGYYDGDGTRMSSEITSGCLRFLEQIKTKYNLSFNIRKDKTAYTLCIGGPLKNKMKEIYPNSMPRKKDNYDKKRVYTRYDVDGNKYMIGYGHRRPKIKKFEVSKSELEKLINEMPLTKIGKLFNVSDNAIKKRAKLLGIQLENRRGYWTKKKAQLI